MVLSSDDSFSKHFPESDLIELLEKAENLPGGLSIHHGVDKHEGKTTRNLLSSFQTQKRTHSESNEDTNLIDRLKLNDNDIYASSPNTDGFRSYMRNKRVKTESGENLKEHEKRNVKQRIFKGVSIYVYGSTIPPSQELRKLILEHGGIFQQHFKRGLVTHVLTTTPVPVNMAEWSQIHIVTPEWVTESVAKGVKLDWHDYECAHEVNVKESLDKKGKTPKKMQTRIKFIKTEHSTPQENNLAPLKRVRSSTPTFPKNQGFGLEPITQREHSPPKQIKVRKMDALGQLGVRLFGFDKKCSESSAPKSESPLKSYPVLEGYEHRERLPSPEKHQLELERHQRNEGPTHCLLQDAISETHENVGIIEFGSQKGQRSKREYKGVSGFTINLASTTTIESQSFAASENSPSPSSAQPLVSSLKHNASATGSATAADQYPSVNVADADSSMRESTPFNPNKSREEPPSNKPQPLHIADPATLEQAARFPSYAVHKSNPHASAVMKNANFRQTCTSASDGFIEGFYRNSRLHYLSAWKAELKNIVAAAHERAQQSAPNHEVRDSKPTQVEKPKTWDMFNKGKKRERDRYFMHCDFDSFFVAVGLLERPNLRGKPVVVCHSQGETGGASSTSEIASASYEAREFGIINGMSLGQARRLCPDIITIPYEFQKYKDLSLKFYSLLLTRADDIQAVSVDEALIEATDSVEDYKAKFINSHPSASVAVLASHDFAKEFAESLRSEVRESTGCEISIGISYSILMARLATRRAKPAGSCHLTVDNVHDFLATIDIDQLHGFGHAVRAKAEAAYGTANLVKLGKVKKELLIRTFGKKTGETIWNAARGIDKSELQSDKPRQSVSCDINFGIRFENNEQAEKFIYQMAKEISSRLDEISMRGQYLTIKIMKRHPNAPIEPPKFLGHGHCETFTKSSSIASPGGGATSDYKVIADQSWRLFSSFNFDPKELRGISIQIQKLEVAPKETKSSIGEPSLKGKSHRDDGDEPFEMQSLLDVGDDNPMPTSSFLEALPPDIRAEVEAQFKKGQSSRDPDTSDAQADLPEKAVVDTKRMARIIQQVAPRNAGSNLAYKSKEGFFERRRERVDVPRSVLLKLGIEPEIFWQLSINDQREQLAIFRARQ